MSTPTTKKLTILTIEQGTFSGVKAKSNEVIKTPERLTALWSQHASRVIPMPAEPKVDFAQEMVIAAFAGTHSSSGHSVSIKQVEDDGSNIVVTLKEEGPPAGTFTASVMTQPFHIVLAPRSDKPVKFAYLA